MTLVLYVGRVYLRPFSFCTVFDNNYASSKLKKTIKFADS